MRRLSKRDKRAILILGIVSGAVAVLLGIALPVYDAADAVEAQLRQQERLLQRHIQASQRSQVYQMQLQELDQFLNDYQESLLDAQDSSIATVQLEEIVRGVAAEHRVEVARSNPLQERKIGENYSKITLQVNLQTSISQLTNFLYSLSTHSKFLLVEDFSINSFRNRNHLRIQPRMKVSALIRLF